MQSPTYAVQVSFGDCDPAGIVFYPNILRWTDSSFHNYLRRSGGHEHICKMLGSIGIGVVESTARFKSPLRDGDWLSITTGVTEWGRKTLTLSHLGRVGEREAFEVTEVRGLFMIGERGMVAGEVGALRALLEEAAE
jgi:4-hydroxybenzoyl-CoA thioesterase